jgi:hypothetical protein
MKERRMVEHREIGRRSAPDLLAEAIKEDIGKGVFGETLPGYRGVMKRYAVSQVTAKVAIRILEKMGVIGPAQKGLPRRILKGNSEEKRNKKLLIMQSDQALSPIDQFMSIDVVKRTWQKHMGEAIEVTVDIRRTRVKKSLQKVLEEHQPHAVFTFVLPKPWNAAIQESGIPLYMLGGTSPKDPEATVSGYSQERATLLALEKLNEKGHQKVLYPLYPTQLMFSDEIRKAYKQTFPSLSEEAIETYTPVLAENHPEVWQSFLQKYYFGVKPTAIIVNTIDHLICVYNFCAQHGLRIPEDFSVVCEEDMPEFAWFSPLPCRMQYPYDKQQRHFLKWVKSDCTWLNEIRFPMKWVEGITIAEL